MSIPSTAVQSPRLDPIPDPHKANCVNQGTYTRISYGWLLDIFPALRECSRFMIVRDLLQSTYVISHPFIQAAEDHGSLHAYSLLCGCEPPM